jgi:hypothetical protein
MAGFNTSKLLAYPQKTGKSRQSFLCGSSEFEGNNGTNRGRTSTLVVTETCSYAKDVTAFVINQ